MPTPADLSLAVGDGARRMTYAELAQARAISLASARRLARRHHWPRQAGNDGIVRVIVPLGHLVPLGPPVSPWDTCRQAQGQRCQKPQKRSHLMSQGRPRLCPLGQGRRQNRMAQG